MNIELIPVCMEFFSVMLLRLRNRSKVTYGLEGNSETATRFAGGYMATVQPLNGSSVLPIGTALLIEISVSVFGCSIGSIFVKLNLFPSLIK